MIMNNKRKSIFIIAQGIEGGITKMAGALARGLVSRGCACKIVYIGRPAATDRTAKDKQHGVESEAIVTGKARSLGEAAGLLKSLFPVWRFLEAAKPDAVIFAGFVPALLYPSLLRPWTKAKFIFWDHGPQNTFQSVKKLFFPFSLKFIDRIVSISKSSALALQNVFGIDGKKIEVVYNGADPEPWQSLPLAPDFSSLHVIMPARLDINSKDHATLIKAAASLRNQGVAIEVTLAGSGPNRKEIMAVIEENRAGDYVHCCPYMEDLPSLVVRHNVVCLSSKFEGLGMALVEGMLARRVVVASRVAGCSEVIDDGETGFLFEPGSVEDCAAKLVALMKRNDLDNIREQGYRKAREKFSPENMVAEFMRIVG